MEHETVVYLRHRKPGEAFVLGGHRVLAVEPTQTENRILLQSAEEGREIGSIEIEDGVERIILFGRPCLIPQILFNIGVKKLNPPWGAIIIVSHSHWESNQDVRPSDNDLLFARQLQETHPNLSLRFRVVYGSSDKPLAFQYLPEPSCK